MADFLDGGSITACDEHICVAITAKYRIASRKSSFLRFKHSIFSDSIHVAPPRPQIRSSAWEQEKHVTFMREKEEDSSLGKLG
jgi:hypothetical protein